MHETHKILGDDSIGITATCVRVPVWRSHSEAVWIETEHELSADDARELLRSAPGVKVIDDPSTSSYPTPSDATGRDDVLVGVSAVTARAATASRCGWSPTTSARAPP